MWRRLDDGRGVDVCGFWELSSGYCTLFATQKKKSCAMVTFLSRDSFFGLQTSCTGAANLPLMSGAGVVHSWEGQACLAVRTRALITSALEAFFPSCRAFCSDTIKTVK